MKNNNTKADQNSLLPSGTLLNHGDYLLGARLGQGGFGVTYLGEQRNELGLKVAIKEYFPRKIASRNITETACLMPKTEPWMTQRDIMALEEKYEEGKRRFIEEARRLAQFNELPSIVSVLGYFEENNTAYIVMEYINGINLYQYLEKTGRTMTVKEMKKYLCPVMEDLDKVHQEGIIHRDISPDNIMLSQSGAVKLIDFGASVEQETEEDVKILRKNGFAPPEQYDRTGKELGAWTDVYALCATMYQLLSGRVIPDARERQYLDKYRTLRSQDILVPAEMDRILKKGLSLDYHKRYQSVKALLRNVRRVSDRGPVGFWVPAALWLFAAAVSMAAGYSILRSRPGGPAAMGEITAWRGAGISQELPSQVESASHYTVYDGLVYIRYTFDDGSVVLVRSPVGTDSFNQVEYVTDGQFDRFCVYDGYLYLTLLEDNCLYRADISRISQTQDSLQQISVWKENGSLERLSNEQLNTEYQFTITGNYAYALKKKADGAEYELLRIALDGKESESTDLHLKLQNCLFQGGYAYFTTYGEGKTVLSRMRLDGCYYEELSSFSGRLPAMELVNGKIYYLLNAEKREESCLGVIDCNGLNRKELAKSLNTDTQYCFMTGIVNENDIYYTCSRAGTEEVNNLYRYSLADGSNKQISSECGRYIATSDEIDSIIFASEDGRELRQMNKDGSNPRIMRGEDGGAEITEGVDITSLVIIQDHVYYLDGGSVAYRRIVSDAV